MIDKTPDIRKLHGLYEDLTTIEVILSVEKMYAWEAWMTRYNAEDLRLVVRMLHGKIKSGVKTWSCLNFRNLIGNLEYFDEDLGEARATSRIAPRSARDATLEQSGRPPYMQPAMCRLKQPGLGDNVQSAESVMRGNAALAELLKLRDSL
jgi:hypothetical protein